jgi:hypothetical protein
MIPISSTQVKKVAAPDSTALLHLRYLTGEHLDQFMRLQKAGGSNLAKYRVQAEKAVKASTHGKSKKEQLTMIAAEMTRLARESGDIDSSDGFAEIREMIDLFLCNWEGEGWPPFPADGKPSRMFLLGDLLALGELITGHVDELVGLSRDEVKN